MTQIKRQPQAMLRGHASPTSIRSCDPKRASWHRCGLGMELMGRCKAVDMDSTLAGAGVFGVPWPQSGAGAVNSDVKVKKVRSGTDSASFLGSHSPVRVLRTLEGLAGKGSSSTTAGGFHYSFINAHERGGGKADEQP